VIRPIPLFIALRYLRTKRKNRFASFVSIASVLGISLGVAVLIVVTSVMNGFEKEVTRHILDMTSHAVIFRPGGAIENWPEMLERIVARPDVVAGAPFVRAGAMLNHKGIVRGIAVQGVATQLERAVSALPDAVDADSFAALDSDPDAILLGTSLAEALEVEIGNRVTLVAPRWHAETGLELPRYYSMTVRGTFSVGMHDFDAGFALVSLANAATIFDLDNGVSGLRMRFTSSDVAPAGAAAIAAALGPDYASINWTQYHRNFFLALKSQKRMMFVILSLIVAVAAFNIVASMVMIVKEKVRDIAVLRTLGLSRGGVMLIFIVQGVVIGFVGVLLGMALGAVLSDRAHQFVSAVERLFGIQFIKPDVYYINYLPADIRAADIVLIAAVAFLICVLATVYPAWQASRTAPAEALRYE
jgi:lipoprotein-releasing system permease protein